METRHSIHTDPAGPPPAAGPACCDYCGESLVALRIVERPGHDGVRRYCCMGCAFIAEQLTSLRTDAPPAAMPDPASSRCAQVDIRGMVCAACALLVEHQLRAAPGVCSAHVDFVSRRALVVYDAARTNPGELARLIERAGYRVPASHDARTEQRATRMELLRVLLAWLAMMQVMMLAIPGYLARPGEISANMEQMLRIGQLILSAPVAIFCAAPFWRAAASQLRVARVGMDVPVAIGLAGAMLASLWSTLRAGGAVYFDSVTMFVALLLAVRWWQMRALAAASAQIDAATRRTQLHARRLREHASRAAFDTIAADALQVGDRVVVPAGEAIPADGKIIEGATSVSQAWLTGESAALEKGEGDVVLAGSLNLDQPIVVRVLRAGDSSSLAALERMIIDAASKRPPGTEFANRIASGFSLAILVLAAGTALAWMLVDPSRALGAAIAVLVVTCPCALSLAAPLAVAVAQARLAADGILLLRPAALEALAGVDTVAFDKTGTLTQERPQLLSLSVLGSLGPDFCLELAAGLEAHSHHPYARALDAAARARMLCPFPAVRVAEAPGMGIEGIVAGQRYRLGKAEYALALVADPAAGARALRAITRGPDRPGAGEVVLAGAEGPLALLQFGETLRTDAPRLLQALARSGKRLLVISGDQPAAVERLLRDLGDGIRGAVDTFAGQSPAGKRAVLDALQVRGHRVAMVGDGINDAPVIAQADASIALASGSRLAQVRADVVVLGTALDSVQRVFTLARRTLRVIRQNLLWALAYNLVMVPLAALGLLSPWIAAGGMALSAALVLANSLRLRTGAAAD